MLGGFGKACKGRRLSFSLEFFGMGLSFGALLSSGLCLKWFGFCLALCVALILFGLSVWFRLGFGVCVLWSSD